MSENAAPVAIYSATANDGVPVELGNGHHMPSKAQAHALAAAKAFKRKDASETTQQIQQALIHNGKPVDIAYVGKSELAKKKNRQDFEDAVHKLAKAEQTRKRDLRGKVLLNSHLAAKSYLASQKVNVSQALAAQLFDETRKFLTLAWKADAAFNNNVVTQELLELRTQGIVKQGEAVIFADKGNVEQYSVFAKNFLRTLWPNALAKQAFSPSPKTEVATQVESKYGADSDYYGADEGDDEPLYKRMVKTPIGIMAVGLAGFFCFLMYQEYKSST
jgi:hypothetical protein